MEKQFVARKQVGLVALITPSKFLKKWILPALFSLPGAPVLAQADSSFIKIPSTQLVLHELSRKDIERLPATNFMQLVQGAFPFVGNESAVEEEFSFLVNGFLLVNPNAIEIGQVESIRYYPAGTSATRGSLFKKGTFLVITRPASNGLSVSSKTGIVLPQKRQNFPGFTVDRTRGYQSLNEISFTQQRKTWYLSNGFSFLHSDLPGQELRNINPANTTEQVQTVEGYYRRYRFSNFGGIQFHPRWKADAAFFYTSMPGDINISNSYRIGQQTEALTGTRDAKTGLTGGNLSIFTDIGEGFSNALSGELLQQREQYGFQSSYRSPFGETLALGSMKHRNNSFTIREDFSWKGQVGQAGFNLSLNSRFRQHKARQSGDTASYVNPATGLPYSNSAGYERSQVSRSLLTGIDLAVQYREMLFVEGGVHYDTYATNELSDNRNKKLLPNAGLRFNVARLLPSSAFSSLELAGQFGQYISDLERYDRIGGRYLSQVIPPGYFQLPNATLAGSYPVVRQWMASFTLGIRGDRHRLGIHYRDRQQVIRAYSVMPIYVGGNTYVALQEQINFKGFAFELASVIAEREALRWDLYAMVFQDRYVWERTSNVMPAEVLPLDQGKAPWRGSIRTNATIRRFFLQAFVTFNYNETGLSENGYPDPDMQRLYANFLVAGYRLPFKNKVVKHIELSAQGSGWIRNSYRPYSNYIGVGVKAGF